MCAALTRPPWARHSTRVRRIVGHGPLRQDQCLELLLALSPSMLSCWRLNPRENQIELALAGDLPRVQWLARAALWRYRASVLRVTGERVGDQRIVRILLAESTETEALPLLPLAHLVELAATFTALRSWAPARRGIGPGRRIRRSSARDLDHQSLRRSELARTP
jgi:hypothetical protein